MRVLITSDIHINQFSSYNICGDPYFRLHQFEKLAERFLEIIHDESVEAVMIAGDFLHVASPRPFVVNAAARFLKQVSSQVPVYVTHGQHDYDSRTHMSRENSLLSLYDNIDNVKYVHKKHVLLGGKSFYFQGWTPEQDFSHVKQDQFDVLIGHATVNGAIMNNYGTTANGPEFANNKFKLCFMGDIHKPQTIKNIVIPGPPIQANFGDDAHNSVIILDTGDLSWKRISTHAGDKIKFLRFITSDSETATDQYTILRKPRSRGVRSKDTVAKSVDVLQTIEDIVASQGLSETHSSVLAITSKLEEDNLDLDYTINSVKINNFRSIKQLEWAPLNGITLIVGKIGTGKSTLVQAIRFVLLGHRTPKSLVTFDQTAMSVEILITYGGTDYRIIRGYQKKSGFLRYFVGDVEIETENQTECGNRIKLDLKFLSLYETLHRSQDNIYFLENHSYSERVALVSKVIKLSITERLRGSAESLKQPLVSSFQQVSAQQQAAQAYLDGFHRMNLQRDDCDYEALLKSGSETLGQISMLLDLERKLQVEATEHEKLSFALAQHPGAELFNMPDLSDQKIELEMSKLHLKGAKDKLTSLEANRKLLSQKTAKLQTISSNTVLQISACETQGEKISSNVCYACNQTINKALVDQLMQKLTEKRTLLKDENCDTLAQIGQLQDETEALDADISNTKSDISHIENRMAVKHAELSRFDELKSTAQRYSQLSDQITSCEERKDALNRRVLLFRETINRRYAMNLTGSEQTLILAQTLRDEIASHREKKISQDKINQMFVEVAKQEIQLAASEKQIETLSKSIQDLSSYAELMGPKGQVIRSVLSTVSENMSNENLRVVAFKKLSNDEVRPDFNVFLRVADHWINYDELSGGQKNLCDLFVLNHLIEMAGGAGSLVLDETFSQVGFEDLEPAVDTLKNMPVRHIFVVSHHENFPAYDNMILTNFDDGGVTTYTMPNGEA